MAFSKLHSSIVNSSLWTESDSTRLLFITLLAMADSKGEVQGSRPGLARIANIDPEKMDEAWETLIAPDPESSDRLRNPANEGRRIEEIPGGFRLLNYEYYRGLRNEDDRREQNRASQKRFREKGVSKPPSATVSRRKPRKAQAEAEEEAEEEATATTAARKLMTLWNLHAGARSARGLSAGRVASATARLTEQPDLAVWEAAARRVGKSDFCQGGGSTGWIADFDWFLKPATLVRIEEGKYDDRMDPDQRRPDLGPEAFAKWRAKQPRPGAASTQVPADGRGEEPDDRLDRR